MSDMTIQNPISDHDEDICSAGATMCHECYAADSDVCDLASDEGTNK